MSSRRSQVYATEEEAFARVEVLRRHDGIWTGITRLPGGGWMLLHDPPTRYGNHYVDTSPPEGEL